MVVNSIENIRWFMVFNSTFNNVSVILSYIVWVSFYWWSKPEYPEKTLYKCDIMKKRMMVLSYLPTYK
jgi:hypothetical protein